MGADNLSLLPIPVPTIGDHLQLVVDGALYCGLVTNREFDLAEIEDSEEGVLKILVFADEKS